MINNSIRHTPDGQKIYVTCHTYPNENLIHAADFNEYDYNIPKGELLFTVSDTGDGIPEDDLSRIFDRNFSGGRRPNEADTSHLGKDVGHLTRSGLGLHISKQIIMQHSGKIFAKNNKYGGAEISFTLPYYK